MTSAALASTQARAAHAALPSPASLRAAAQAAARQGEPLVVMTTLAGCPFCDLVRNNYLLPLSREDGVHAVQIDIRDRHSNLQGFAGENTTPAEQVIRWNARVAPTVLFFASNGRELAERLVGVASLDFYGAQLEDRLREARDNLK